MPLAPTSLQGPLPQRKTAAPAIARDTPAWSLQWVKIGSCMSPKAQTLKSLVGPCGFFLHGCLGLDCPGGLAHCPAKTHMQRCRPWAPLKDKVALNSPSFHDDRHYVEGLPGPALRSGGRTGGGGGGPLPQSSWLTPRELTPTEGSQKSGKCVTHADSARTRPSGSRGGSSGPFQSRYTGFNTHTHVCTHGTHTHH